MCDEAHVDSLRHRGREKSNYRALWPQRRLLSHPPLLEVLKLGPARLCFNNLGAKCVQRNAVEPKGLDSKCGDRNQGRARFFCPELISENAACRWSNSTTM